MIIIRELKATDLSMNHVLNNPNIKFDTKTTRIINSINLAVTELIARKTKVNMSRLNGMYYAAAAVAIKEAQYSLKPI